MEDLYDLAERHGVAVLSFPLPECKSLSMQQGGACYVGLDNSGMTAAEERCRLGHELGHCLHSGFYTRKTPFDIREQHERRADVWFIKRYIPFDRLAQLLRAGREVCEIADALDVTEDYIVKAYFYYKDAGASFGTSA